MTSYVASRQGTVVVNFTNKTNHLVSRIMSTIPLFSVIICRLLTTFPYPRLIYILKQKPVSDEMDSDAVQFFVERN